MSNTLAVAAVTAAIRDLLNQAAQPLPGDPSPDLDLADVTCTTRPPDKARTDDGSNQLNLFLFRTAPNAAMRNMDMPGTTRPLETASPPLALDLSYLVTAYGKNSDDVLAHRVLGRAMSILHDRALLLPSDFTLKNNDLSRQVERVRITPQPISTEELSKLWTIFQAPYRVSATYQVAVVLIDSQRPTRAPLPVLVPSGTVVARITPPVPTLTDIALPIVEQPAARPPSAGPPPKAGDVITLVGHDLAGTGVSVEFTHPLLATPNSVAATSATDTSLTVALPDDPERWPAGIYSVSATVTTASGARSTNSLPLVIAPRITAVTKGTVSGVTTLTVGASPTVQAAQRASLIVGSVELRASTRATAADPLTFAASGVAPGTYRLRLRVDGIDSFVVDYAADPPAFDPDPLLRVTLP